MACPDGELLQHNLRVPCMSKPGIKQSQALQQFEHSLQVTMGNKAAVESISRVAERQGPAHLMFSGLKAGAVPFLIRRQ